VTVAGVTGDGKPDLIVTDYDTAMVSVLVNTSAPGAATPSFTRQRTFATGTSPGLDRGGRPNGSGKPDVIMPKIDGDTISVLLDTTTAGAALASFTQQQTYIAGNGPVAVTAVDINGDRAWSWRTVLTPPSRYCAPTPTRRPVSAQSDLRQGRRPVLLIIEEAGEIQPRTGTVVRRFANAGAD
jgi:hypothetical protein